MDPAFRTTATEGLLEAYGELELAFFQVSAVSKVVLVRKLHEFPCSTAHNCLPLAEFVCLQDDSWLYLLLEKKPIGLL